MLSGNITYAYNDAGWLTSKLGPVSSTIGTFWAYDNLGRVTQETRGSGGREKVGREKVSGTVKRLGLICY